jgi:heme oxygenase
MHSIPPSPSAHRLSLKEATAEKHRLAERTAFNARMFRGLLPAQDYVNYLVQIRAIFAEIERTPLPHSGLARLAAVEADIQELLDQGLVPGGLVGATRAYVARLAQASDADRMAHVYLNYLALMFGGQVMKANVPSTGRLYDFEDMPAALRAVRAVQRDEWADEVNAGFDHLIGLFEELEAASSAIPRS